MQNSATTVDEYLVSVPEERKAVLMRLRTLCRDTLTAHDEFMHYKMPTYARDGKVEVAFASQKNYIALYVTKEGVVNRYRDALPGVGKGCIRFCKPEDVDFALVSQLLHDTAASAEAPC